MIFLVDCSSRMFARNPHNPDGIDSVTHVLKATLSFMKTKIITSDSDRIGMILFNTGTTSNSLNFENVCVMIQLDQTDAQIIKNFQSQIDTFNKQVKATEGVQNLYEALWICYQEFKSVEKQNYAKRIFLFTDEDQPYHTEERVKLAV